MSQRFRLAIFAVVALALCEVGCAEAPAVGEHAAVERAVLDYVEAVEQGRPELIERSVHPDLAKFGFSFSDPAETPRVIPMTYAKLVDFAATTKALGYVPHNATHQVEVFEVLNLTASAKLTAFWGIDYMHLARYDGRWKIVQVLWQSPPSGGQ
jgi:hypothetical protein